MDAAPPAMDRAKFALFLFARRLGPRDVAPALGCSHEQVRRICLPYDDPQWRRPSGKLKEKIRTYTKGEVGLADWTAVKPREVAAQQRAAA